MRRAQIEMMGLVMVVILVTIGLFFSVAFQKPKAEKQPLAVYSDEQLATNYLIILLETHIEGYSLKAHDLAVDCVRDHATGSPKYSFGSLGPCEKLRSVTETIVADTLDQWGYNYQLRYLYTDLSNERHDLFPPIESGACDGRKSAPGIQAISLFRVVSGSAVMRLDICTETTP